MILPSLLVAISFLPFFEAKNTVANYIIEPPADGTAITCEKPNMTVVEKCPACDGEGHIMMQEENFGQANGRLGTGQKKRIICPLCKNKKKLTAFMKPSELTLLVAQEREKFNSTHQAKGEIAVGEAFVPREAHEKLGRDKIKLIEEAYGHPCQTCHWTGLEPCKKCSGQGVMNCPNKDCKGGWAVTKTTTSYTRSKSGGSNLNRGYNRGGMSSSGGSRRISRKEEKINVHVCDECEGAKKIICPDCQGRRAIPCRKCNGLGSKKKGFGL